MKGFPGLLNTLGTLLDRSQTILQNFKKLKKMWKLDACMRLLLGAKSMPFGCMSMARLGAKYAEVECKVYKYFWVHVYAFWVHVYGSVGCMYAVVGCKYMETFGCKVYAFWVHF